MAVERDEGIFPRPQVAPEEIIDGQGRLSAAGCPGDEDGGRGFENIFLFGSEAEEELEFLRRTAPDPPPFGLFDGIPALTAGLVIGLFGDRFLGEAGGIQVVQARILGQRLGIIMEL